MRLNVQQQLERLASLSELSRQTCAYNLHGVNIAKYCMRAESFRRLCDEIVLETLEMNFLELRRKSSKTANDETFHEFTR